MIDMASRRLREQADKLVRIKVHRTVFLAAQDPPQQPMAAMTP